MEATQDFDAFTGNTSDYEPYLLHMLSFAARHYVEFCEPFQFVECTGELVSAGLIDHPAFKSIAWC